MDLLFYENASYQTVIHQLSERYNNNIFYTWAGPTLVAINPLCDVPHLYGVEKIYKLNSEDKKSSTTSPHIYRIAERALKYIKWNNRDQAIIVNGDSGAGKTYSARHLLQYLATVDSFDKKDGTTLEDRICWTNPIMESFGNAQTIRNSNSSRFGKLLQLKYSNGRLTTGQIKPYLLEQTRISSQVDGERNFHIFYQIVSGLSSEERKSLFINRQFKILKSAPTEADSSDFVQTLNAFSELGFQKEDLTNIFQTLSILLNLGNVEFLENMDGSWTVNEEQEEWVAVCKLASVDGESLSSCLTILTISAGTMDKRAGVFFKPCETEAECVSRRDCLMRLIYSTLFLWLVEELNKKLRNDKVATDGLIGILDVYGFESLLTNSLEQLCINYANERLQLFFVHNFLQYQKLSLIDEGLDVSDVGVVSNNIVIAMMDGPVSVFGVLNEECRMKRYPTDEQLVHRITQAIEPTPVKSSPIPKRAKRGATAEFRVQHYAGEVTYNAAGMLEKNSDQIPVEMVHLLSNSADKFIQRLFKPSASLSSPTQKSGRKHTVLAKFKNSVDNLLSMLNSCEVHYIRCVKPHEAMEIGPIDPVYLLRKLNECGVMDTVRLASLGLPIRMPFLNFFDRFKCLTSTPTASVDDYREFCQILIKLLQKSDASINSSQVQIGKKRIFMSEKVSEYLETLRQGNRNKAAMVILRSYRRFRLRKRTVAALKIQRCWNRFRDRGRNLAALAEHAATRIQAAYRGWRSRVAFIQILKAVTTMQKTTRGWSARRKVQEMKRRSMQDSLLMDSNSLSATEYTDSSGVTSPFENSSDISMDDFVTVRRKVGLEHVSELKGASPKAVAIVSPFRSECLSSTRPNFSSAKSKEQQDEFKPIPATTFLFFNNLHVPEKKEFFKDWHWKRGILSIRRVTEINVNFICRKKCLNFAENRPASELPQGLLDIFC